MMRKFLVVYSFPTKTGNEIVNDVCPIEGKVDMDQILTWEADFAREYDMRRNNVSVINFIELEK